MTRVFSDLRRYNFFRELTTDELAAQAAQFLAELNAIHPFRDGYGRSQVTFLAVLADAAGHPLTLSNLEPEDWLDAMIDSFHGNSVALTAQIRGLLQG